MLGGQPPTKSGPYAWTSRTVYHRTKYGSDLNLFGDSRTTQVIPVVVVVVVHVGRPNEKLKPVLSRES